MPASEMIEDLGATRALVRRVRAIHYEAIPDEAREAARHCLLDFLGCALAGAADPLTDVLVREVVAGEGGSQAGLIGRPERSYDGFARSATRRSPTRRARPRATACSTSWDVPWRVRAIR